MKTPWHIWVVGGVTLLWNAMGAMDYVMTQTRNEAYMAAFTPEQLEYFYGFPSWVQGTWAIAVWGSVLGSLLLLLRHRAAVPVFAVAFLAMLATTVHNFLLSDVSMADVTGPEALIFSAVIFAVALLLYIYARAMRQRGHLR